MTEQATTPQPETAATLNVITGSGTVHRLTAGRTYTHRGWASANRPGSPVGKADCGSLTSQAAKVTDAPVSCPGCLDREAAAPAACAKCERASTDPSIVCREHRPVQRAAERVVNVRKFDHPNDTYAWSCSCGTTSAASSVTPIGRDAAVTLHLECEHFGQPVTVLVTEQTTHRFIYSPVSGQDELSCSSDRDYFATFEDGACGKCGQPISIGKPQTDR